MLTSIDHRKPGAIVKRMQAQGWTTERNLFWSWYEPRNFGDWVGPYLYEALTGKRPLHCAPRHKPYGQGCYYFAGSILRRITVPDYAIVWGSGIISDSDTFPRPKRVHAVRGPRTAARLHQLGYECPDTYGDPAVLLPSVYTPHDRELRHRVGFIPHFVDLPAYRAAGLDKDDQRLIDVGLPVEAVIDEIAQCEFTVSSSLHGLIVSHAYGIPSVWVQSLSPLDGDGVKFHDYYESVGDDTPSPIQFVPEGDVATDSLQRAATLPAHDRVRNDLRRTCPLPIRR